MRIDRFNILKNIPLRLKYLEYCKNIPKEYYDCVTYCGWCIYKRYNPTRTPYCKYIGMGKSYDDYYERERKKEERDALAREKLERECMSELNKAIESFQHSARYLTSDSSMKTILEIGANLKKVKELKEKA